MNCNLRAARHLVMVLLPNSLEVCGSFHDKFPDALKALKKSTLEKFKSEEPKKVQNEALLARKALKKLAKEKEILADQTLLKKKVFEGLKHAKPNRLLGSAFAAFQHNVEVIKAKGTPPLSSQPIPGQIRPCFEQHLEWGKTPFRATHSITNPKLPSVVVYDDVPGDVLNRYLPKYPTNWNRTDGPTFKEAPKQNIYKSWVPPEQNIHDRHMKYVFLRNGTRVEHHGFVYKQIKDADEEYKNWLGIDVNRGSEPVAQVIHFLSSNKNGECMRQIGYVSMDTEMKPILSGADTSQIVVDSRRQRRI